MWTGFSIRTIWFGPFFQFQMARRKGNIFISYSCVDSSQSHIHEFNCLEQHLFARTISILIDIFYTVHNTLEIKLVYTTSLNIKYK